MLCVIVKPDAFACTNKIKVKTYILPKKYTILFTRKVLFYRELSDRNIRCKMSRKVDKITTKNHPNWLENKSFAKKKTRKHCF